MQIVRLVDILKALGHPTRLQMVCLLRAQGEVNVTDLRQMTKSKQSLASQQLAILRRSGVIFGRRQANVVFYRLAIPLIPLIDQVINLKEG